MNTTDVCLTLMLPKVLEDRVIDLLLEQDMQRAGFTVCELDQLGREVRYDSVLEQVRGRAHRVQLQMIVHHDIAKNLIATLKQALTGSSIIYCITPVLESGSIV